MSLSCGCDSDDGYLSLYKEKWVRARKLHVCQECKKQIAIGEEYNYVFIVYEGDAESSYLCEGCANITESLVDLGFCWERGELAHAYIEYLEQYTNSVRYNEETDKTELPRNHLTEAVVKKDCNYDYTIREHTDEGQTMSRKSSKQTIYAFDYDSKPTSPPDCGTMTEHEITERDEEIQEIVDTKIVQLKRMLRAGEYALHSVVDTAEDEAADFHDAARILFAFYALDLEPDYLPASVKLAAVEFIQQVRAVLTNAEEKKL